MVWDTPREVLRNERARHRSNSRYNFDFDPGITWDRGWGEDSSNATFWLPGAGGMAANLFAGAIVEQLLWELFFSLRRHSGLPNRFHNGANNSLLAISLTRAGSGSRVCQVATSSAVTTPSGALSLSPA